MKIKPIFSLLLCATLAHVTIWSQWVQSDGPIGGSITSLRTIGQSVVAATATGSIFRSSDGGETWRSICFGLPKRSKPILEANASSLFIVWPEEGVFRSLDEGITWTLIYGPQTFDQLTSFAVAGDVLYRSSPQYLYRSTNDGTTWTKVNEGFTTVPKKLFSSPWVPFAQLSAKSHYSRDSGKSWIRLENAVGSSVHDFLATSGVSSDGTTLLWVHSEGVGRSRFSEGTWTPFVNDFSAQTPLAVYVKGSAAYLGGLYFGIRRSIDSGKTWVESALAQSTMEIGALIVLNDRVFAGTRGYGVLQSSDKGISWEACGPGLASSVVTGLVRVGTSVIAGTEDGVFISDDDGLSWHAQGSDELLHPVKMMVASKNEVCVLLTGTMTRPIDESKNLVRSDDNGQTWNSILGPNGQSARSIGAHNGKLYATYWYGFYRSTDGGTSWDSLSPPPGGLINEYCFDGDRILVATEEGVGEYQETESRWRRMLQGAILAVAVKGSVIMAGTRDNGLFRSVDNGVIWSPAPLPSTAKQINDIDIVNGAIVVTSSSGLEFSTDDGFTWDTCGSGLDRAVTTTFLLSADHVLVGTHGEGVWTRPIGEFSQHVTEVEDYCISEPAAQTLLTASADGLVTLNVNCTSIATLNIVNSQGSLIRTIRDFIIAGPNTIQMNVHNLSCGLYFIHIIGLGNTFAPRAILIVR